MNWDTWQCMINTDLCGALFAIEEGAIPGHCPFCLTTELAQYVGPEEKGKAELIEKIEKMIDEGMPGNTDSCLECRTVYDADAYDDCPECGWPGDQEGGP